jgi:hypothetical protein
MQKNKDGSCPYYLFKFMKPLQSLALSSVLILGTASTAAALWVDSGGNAHSNLESCWAARMYCRFAGRINVYNRDGSLRRVINPGSSSNGTIGIRTDGSGTPVCLGKGGTFSKPLPRCGRDEIDVSLTYI